MRCNKLNAFMIFSFSKRRLTPRTAVISAIVIAGLSVCAAFIADRDVFARAFALFTEAGGAFSGGAIGVLLALSLINYILRAERWALAVRTARPDYIRDDAVRHYFAGFAFTVTPGKAGELVRLWFLKRDYGIAFSKGTAFSMSDRFFDFLALTLCLIPGLFAHPEFRVYAAAPFLLCALLIGAALSPETGRELLKAGYGKLKRGKRVFAAGLRFFRALEPLKALHIFTPSFILSLGGWFAEVVAFYYVLDWLGLDISLATAAFIFAAAALAGAMLMTPGGTGGAEAMTAFLLTRQGADFETALVATVIIRLTTLWFAVGLGIIIAPFVFKNARKVQNAAHLVARR